ncbi:MAG: 50S ribosomal protein L11 methyltransferase [Clostridiales bacterium]|nr:50S ribosomal protein L11 methyltransferase [Clostridiales bacterium]
MDWTEINIEIAASAVEEAAAIAQMVVPYGIYIEDYSDLRTEAPKIAHIDLIDEELLQKDVTRALIHIYISPDDNPAEAIAFLREKYTAAGIENRISTESVRQEEWATAWKTYYHPTKLGERLVVCPSWEEYQPAEGEVVITLDPGMAFGTGSHDTTRLCLQLLEQHCAPGKRVLDIGSGSGILAISSVLLGCDRAVGVEIDPTAVRVARENSAINHTDDRVEFLCGDLVQQVSGRYHIVCANIVADVIIRLLPDVGQFMEEGAALILSGIIDEREADVLAALEQNALAVAQRRESAGWVALLCEKR